MIIRTACCVHSTRYLTSPSASIKIDRAGFLEFFYFFFPKLAFLNSKKTILLSGLRACVRCMLLVSFGVGHRLFQFGWRICDRIKSQKCSLIDSIWKRGIIHREYADLHKKMRLRVECVRFHKDDRDFRLLFFFFFFSFKALTLSHLNELKLCFSTWYIVLKEMSKYCSPAETLGRACMPI